ncbi:class I SAM-dependent methyltransferase [Clostridium guangxiense]|uniref:class I SAM-dependent methyltransferase n=1 Tax=Clostridium guangxiense TaxID=1662055 RepID=UPI002ED8FFAD
MCTSTLHHATLSDIKQGINEICRILKPNRYFVFNFLSTLDPSYGIGTKIEENTFVGSRIGEENIPHHYTDENELEALLNKFSFANINKSIYSFYDSKNNEYTSKVFDILAVK